MRLRFFATVFAVLLIPSSGTAQEDDQARLEELRRSMTFLEAPKEGEPGSPHGFRITNRKETRYLRWETPLELATKAAGLECLPELEYLAVRVCKLPTRWQPFLGKMALADKANLEFFEGKFFKYTIHFDSHFAGSIAASIERALGAATKKETKTALNLMGAEIPREIWTWKTESALVEIASRRIEALTEGSLVVSYTPIDEKFQLPEVEAPF